MNDNRFPKQPGEVMDYDIDLSTWLSANDDAIATYSVDADTGITLDSHGESGGVIKVWLSGGTDKTIYRVEAKVVTVEGREVHAPIYIHVRDE